MISKILADRPSRVPVLSLVVIAPVFGMPADREVDVSVDYPIDERWQTVLAAGEVGDRSSSMASHSHQAVSVRDSLGDRLCEGLRFAQGEFVVFVSHQQSVSHELLRTVLAEIESRPGVDVLYFDEIRVGAAEFFSKPTSSPERLRSQNYWGSFVVYRRSLLDAVMSRPIQFAGAELYTLALRASRLTESIASTPVQIPGDGVDLEREWCFDDDQRLRGIRQALEEHLLETGGGDVVSVGSGTTHETRRPVNGSPLVSIIIPSRGSELTVRGQRRLMVLEAIRDITARTTYGNYEVVIVIDEGFPDGLIERISSMLGPRVSFVPWLRPFSFSGKMNLGAVHARGEYLLFLNDDVEIISPNWVEALLSLAQLPGAGTVGAMLYFVDDTIQHAGHYYSESVVTHIGLHSERGAPGPDDAFLIDREVDGNTAACMMVVRDRFFEVGGFSPLLPNNFNDVDLCMKMRVCGYTSYWTPHAELYHFESASRDPRVSQYEVRFMWGRWERELAGSQLWPIDPTIVYRRQPID